MDTDILTNLAKPRTAATLTLRVVKSFEYRTEKSLVLHAVNCELTTVADLKDRARQSVFFPVDSPPVDGDPEKSTYIRAPIQTCANAHCHSSPRYVFTPDSCWPRSMLNHGRI